MLTNDDWLLLAILFFVFMASFALYYARTVKKARILDPIALFLFFYCLFVLPLPIRAYITKEIVGDVTEHLPELLPYMPWAVFLSAIGLPFFVWGYYSKLTWRVAWRLPVPRTGEHARLAYVVVSGISLLLLIDLARDTGGLLDFILLGYNSTASMYGKGYLAVGFPGMFVASLFLFYRFASRRKKIDLMLFVVTFALVVLTQTIMGRRSDLLYVGLAVLLYWHTAFRPVSTKFMAALAIILFLGLNALGFVRSSNYADLREVWTQTTSKDTGQQVSENLFYTISTGEFVGPFDTLPQMIKSVGREFPPKFGLTYLRAPLFWIPSVVFPARPVTLTHWYMESFYGGGFELNQGNAFFFTSEGYLNFGPLGVLGTMLFWGWYLGAVHRYRDLSRGEPGALMLYSLTVAFLFEGMAGDFVSIFAVLPGQILSAAVVGIWIANWGGLRKGVWRRQVSVVRGPHLHPAGALASGER